MSVLFISNTADKILNLFDILKIIANKKAKSLTNVNQLTVPALVLPQVKNPGPKDLALACPLEGGSPCCCSAQHTYRVLE
jgi:hypothetical protein